MEELQDGGGGAQGGEGVVEVQQLPFLAPTETAQLRPRPRHGHPNPGGRWLTHAGVVFVVVVAVKVHASPAEHRVPPFVPSRPSVCVDSLAHTSAAASATSRVLHSTSPIIEPQILIGCHIYHHGTKKTMINDYKAWLAYFGSVVMETETLLSEPPGK